MTIHKERRRESEYITHLSLLPSSNVLLALPIARGRVNEPSDEGHRARQRSIGSKPRGANRVANAIIQKL